MGKYFKYAIGEILLVVIGILIALSINNWNENRKDRLLEKDYLERLKYDIIQDTTNLRKELLMVKERRIIIESFANSLNNATPDSIVVAKTQRFFDEGWFLPVFSYSKSTFTDLSSTGKLSIIENVDLREGIIAFYGNYEEFSRGAQNNDLWILPMDAKLVMETNAMKFDQRTSHLFDDVRSIQELKNDRDLILRVAAAHYWGSQTVVNVYKRVISDAVEILNAIESELNP